MRRTLTGDDEEAEGRADGINVRLVNNTWNVEPRVNGTDFTQTVTYNPSDLTRDVVFEWDFGPDDQAGVLSYPEIAFGESPWSRGGATELVTRIDELRELDVAVDLSISGRTDQFNVAFDLWLTDTPLGDYRHITTELMIWLHAPASDVGLPVVATWSSNGAAAKVYAEEEFSIEPGLEWRYVAVVFDGDFLEGTVDIDGLMRFLTERGLISGTDYIGGLELGSEVQGYAGRTTLHSIDVVHSAYDITEKADRLIGGRQDDVVDGRGGADLIDGRKGMDRLSGGTGADRLHGGEGADELRGGKGTDRLWGDDGGDRLWGGKDADRLWGGEGRDRLWGGEGRDTLNGGMQADVMTGGSGADVFIFRGAQQAGRTREGSDRITDFGAGADRIDLATIDADTRQDGNQAFKFIGSGRFSGHEGELRAVRTGSETWVSADLDGDRVADLWLHLTGTPLTEAMFDL